MFLITSSIDFTKNSRSPLKSLPFSPFIASWHACAETSTAATSPSSSMVNPAASYAGAPPSSTNTLSRPNTLNIHHARATENIPSLSYSTTALSSIRPSAFRAARIPCVDGSMCGAGFAPSLTPSMSKNFAPGILFALNSSTALRFNAGMCHDASTTWMSARLSLTHFGVTSVVVDVEAMTTVRTLERGTFPRCAVRRAPCGSRRAVKANGVRYARITEA
mmetsp:Transcript_8188/g.27154  ORF Transcript_8188/g.27154 Transcript_8188/m.27154 type:complete len:220 (-) Transcript_8188:6-665(-)